MAIYIDNTNDLKSLCDTLSRATFIALDTEFVGDHSYFPTLALIQIAVNGQTYLIDPLAVKALNGLGEALANPDSKIIVHDGGIDIQILKRATGITLTNVFDTQLAAAFCGLGESVGLSTLIRRLTGQRLSKGQQVSDWLKRPLNDKQLKYAAEDVIHLEEAAQTLSKRLNRLKRWRVFEEEMVLRSTQWTQPINIDARFKKILDKPRLSARQRAALRQLIVWREETAVERNIPRRQVMSDEALIAVCEQQPQSRNDLKNLRLVSDKAVKRYGAILTDICQAARNLPDDHLPNPRRRHSNRERSSSRAPVVKLALEVLATQAGIAPGLVARAEEVEELCRAAAESSRRPDLPSMKGWRGRLVGKKLWDFARGELTLRVGTDPNGPPVLIEPCPTDRSEEKKGD